jgi:hypothetical protein
MIFFQKMKILGSKLSNSVRANGEGLPTNLAVPLAQVYENMQITATPFESTISIPSTRNIPAPPPPPLIRPLIISNPGVESGIKVHMKKQIC